MTRARSHEPKPSTYPPGYVPSSQCQTTAFVLKRNAKTILSRRSSNFFQTRMYSWLQRQQRSNKRPTARHERLRVPNQKWWSRTGSNRRPEACKATALPTELRPPGGVGLSHPHVPCNTQTSPNAEGVERPTGRRACLRVKPRRRTSPPAFEASIKWWAWDDSNVRPHPYQGCALTT